MRLNVFVILVGVSLLITSCQSGSGPKLIDNMGSGKPHENNNHIVKSEDVHGERPKLEQKDITVDVAEGGITISDLYSNRDSYADKMVKVRGEVVKVNPDIMGINWIHIQDGTSDSGNFDLTVTTHDKPEVGDIVTFEGKISVNKDFGAGYKYNVIMEDAKQADQQY